MISATPKNAENWSDRDWVVAEKVVLAMRAIRLQKAATIEIRFTKTGEIIFYTRTSTELTRIGPSPSRAWE